MKSFLRPCQRRAQLLSMAECSTHQSRTRKRASSAGSFSTRTTSSFRLLTIQFSKIRTAFFSAPVQRAVTSTSRLQTKSILKSSKHSSCKLLDNSVIDLWRLLFFVVLQYMILAIAATSVFSCSFRGSFFHPDNSVHPVYFSISF